MKDWNKQEKNISEKIVEVHNLFLELEREHPTEIHEWVDGIHRLQNVMGMRLLRKVFPERFPKKI